MRAGLGCPGKGGPCVPLQRCCPSSAQASREGCDLETAPAFLGPSAFRGLLLSCPLSGTMEVAVASPRLLTVTLLPAGGRHLVHVEPGEGGPEKVPQPCWALLEPPGQHPAWPEFPALTQVAYQLGDGV